VRAAIAQAVQPQFLHKTRAICNSLAFRANEPSVLGGSKASPAGVLERPTATRAVCVSVLYEPCKSV